MASKDSGEAHLAVHENALLRNLSYGKKNISFLSDITLDFLVSGGNYNVDPDTLPFYFSFVIVKFAFVLSRILYQTKLYTKQNLFNPSSFTDIGKKNNGISGKCGP